MDRSKYTIWVFLLALTVGFTSCQDAEENSPGSEYMPDMGHSIAYEANVLSDYYFNTWDDESTMSLRSLTEHNKPVEGTVPRGYAGVYFAQDSAASVAGVNRVMTVMTGQDQMNSMTIPMNGHVPYYYGDTEEERTRAIAEIRRNPFPITANGLERGKELYNIFCGICHGEKGDGVGYLVSDDNQDAAYPAAPANFLLDEHVNASNGRYYHAIMYGKNVMGAYADKISYEERWQVIHYIRSLQAKEKKLEYSAESNTLNAAFGTPSANTQIAENLNQPMPLSDETETTPGESATSEGSDEMEDINEEIGNDQQELEENTGGQ